jgi:hypothetical protein
MYPSTLADIETYDFDTQRIENAVEKLAIYEIKEIALFFEENVANVLELILLPFRVAAPGPWQALTSTLETSLGIQALTRLNETGLSTSNDDIRQQVARSLETASQNPNLVRQFSEQAYTGMISALNNMKTGKQQPIVDILFGAATLNTWMAFECLAADLWSTAVNLRPNQFAQRAASKIDVTMLCKYGFDVSKVMGNLLRPSRDFTGIEGICEAYDDVFEHFDPKSVKDNRHLLVLEKKRHLLAHRNGEVDEQFNRRTGLNLTLGSRVPCGLSDLTNDVNAVMDVGCRLLSCVDAHIQAAKP